MGKQEARIAYVLKIDDLKHAMETLEAGLKAYPGRQLSDKVPVKDHQGRE
jgi:aspartate aminotransferase